ncbi:hypothetical protein GWI33_002931 [Rhynchophorus ferrugineus]|uniref:Uncharacterized protein n=1 Tax=Rhynchophorus ferrugineus TaxID=354439 RepID=A0A834IMH8_RHYFE|nr:hypothetical protein GWI33_002931 [Rhynchophorus ferrugineus]
MDRVPIGVTSWGHMAANKPFVLSGPKPGREAGNPAAPARIRRPDATTYDLVGRSDLMRVAAKIEILIWTAASSN